MVSGFPGTLLSPPLSLPFPVLCLGTPGPGATVVAAEVLLSGVAERGAPVGP